MPTSDESTNNTWKIIVLIVIVVVFGLAGWISLI